MSDTISRRTLLRGSATIGSVAAMGLLDWALPALAQGEEVIPWTDMAAGGRGGGPARGAGAGAPRGGAGGGAGAPRGAGGAAPRGGGAAPRGGGGGGGSLDTSTLQRSSFFTPVQDFYLVQHYGQQTLDPATYRLQLTGLVNKPMELTLDQLKQRPRTEIVAGFECGGSSPTNFNRLCGNGRWAGTSLSALLRDAGLQPHAREVVFFGADKGEESVTHGRGTQQVEQHFGRSMTTDDAMRPEMLICWEMNGQPLADNHGAPVRLIAPGWYGVANVKWLNHIHVQDTRFMGRFMTRDYVTLIGQDIAGETIWNETSVSRMRIKSMVARLTRVGTRYTALGFVLHDGTPLRSVEVRLDNGPWQAARLDDQNTQFSWKFFTIEMNNIPAGDHTIVSRVTDVNGVSQPEESALADKKTMWENNGQFVRRFTI